jgi:DNA-binding CsgD family transcriptional regulator
MPKATSTAPHLLEREAELQALERAIVAAREGSGSLVVLAGEAGMGKTALVRHALGQAGRAGLRTLTATGSELERQHPYGVAVALFESHVREHDSAGPAGEAELFAGPAAMVAPLFGRSSGTGRPKGDPFATVHGLYWLLLNAAEEGPLVLAVDDAQWSDDGSLRFLHYVAQRASELPAVIIMAFRIGEAASDEVVGQLFLSDRTALHIEPPPLSRRAVEELLGREHRSEMGAELTQACWDATRGNPFFVIELARALDPARTGPAKRAKRDIAGIVPQGVKRFVDARVARLDPHNRRLAEAVAVLGEEATLGRAATLAGLGEDVAMEGLRRLARLRILDPGEATTFAHPIVRSAVYEAIPRALRMRAHREAARLLDMTAAPAGVAAVHLLEAERTGDRRAVEILLAAAAQARARGQPAVAAELLRRALEEPPDDLRRRDALIELARAEASAGARSAVARYDEALALTADRRQRAGLLLELGHLLVGNARHRDAAETFRRGMAELDDRTDPLHARLEAGYVPSAWMGIGHDETADRMGARILSDALFGPAHRELVMSIAFQRSITGSTSANEMLDLVRRVLAEAPIEVLVREGMLIELATGVLFATDDLVGHGELLKRAIEVAREAGDYSKIGLYSVAKGWSDLFRGQLADAVADTEAGIRAAELGWEAFYPVACAIKSLAHLERGELTEAKKILRTAEEPWAERADWLVVLIARGRLHAALGDTARALDELHAAASHGSRFAFRNPGPPEWRGWLAVALARKGRSEEARAVAREGVEIARAWGAQWPLGAALRAAAVAENGRRSEDLLREAVALLEGSPAELELARAQVDLGALLRRRGRLREARETLASAMDLSHRLGATALLEQSRAELRAAGSRPRRYARTGLAALTPSEARVAHLAAEGHTNREIAETLFVTPKAVEYHLANTFGKLGISSRHELGKALDAGDLGSASVS